MARSHVRDNVSGSVVVDNPACHVEDPGSIPGQSIHTGVEPQLFFPQDLYFIACCSSDT